MDYTDFDQLPEEKLRDLCRIFAKNWLAMDGVWFQSVERKYGMDEAMYHDAEAWRRFAPIEAKRIKEFLALPDRAGVQGLERALSFRLYALLNQCETHIDGDTLTYRVITCRVQAARQRKGMDFHPCKPVGLIEYQQFASVIDDRFEVTALSCHPEAVDPGCCCSWRFTLRRDGE